MTRPARLRFFEYFEEPSGELGEEYWFQMPARNIGAVDRTAADEAAELLKPLADALGAVLPVGPQWGRALRDRVDPTARPDSFRGAVALIKGDVTELSWPALSQLLRACDHTVQVRPVGAVQTLESWIEASLREAEADLQASRHVIDTLETTVADLRTQLERLRRRRG